MPPLTWKPSAWKSWFQSFPEGVQHRYRCWYSSTGLLILLCTSCLAIIATQFCRDRPHWILSPPSSTNSLYRSLLINFRTLPVCILGCHGVSCLRKLVFIGLLQRVFHRTSVKISTTQILMDQLIRNTSDFKLCLFFLPLLPWSSVLSVWNANFHVVINGPLSLTALDSK